LLGAWVPFVPFTQLQDVLGTSWTCSGGREVSLIEDNPIPLPGTWTCDGPFGAMVVISGGPPESQTAPPPEDVIAGNSTVVPTGVP
jgi:hypothetical protein